MAVNAIITDAGVAETINAQADQGYFIDFTKFSVSSTKGTLVSTRTTENNAGADVWFPKTVITAYQQIDDNTIELTLSIPSGENGNVAVDAQEIYIWCEDKVATEFLFAIGQTDPIQAYDPAGSLTFKIQFQVTNVSLSSTYNFTSTVATEVSTHDADNGAHSFLRGLIEYGGAYNTLGNRNYVGQSFDQYPTMAAGIVATDLVYYDTGNTNYGKALADGTEAQRVVGMYIESGEATSKDFIVNEGIVDYTHAFIPQTRLFLSLSVSGGITAENTGILVGYAMQGNKIFLQVGDTEQPVSVPNIGILNNQTVSQNIANAIYDKAKFSYMKFTYGSRRKTTTNSNYQCGDLFLIHDNFNDVLVVSWTEQIDTGMTFQITAGGQLGYKSSDVVGVTYTGRLDLVLVDYVRQ